MESALNVKLFYSYKGNHEATIQKKTAKREEQGKTLKDMMPYQPISSRHMYFGKISLV